ncbi:hypothetical protein VNO77_30933 [Canavalia gladiata]|uniref:Secreted protein n=1 Tax=Canavalia gladiata TaxID=3824 RepID=A0AAN9KS99_CANGL
MGYHLHALLTLFVSSVKHVRICHILTLFEPTRNAFDQNPLSLFPFFEYPCGYSRNARKAVTVTFTNITFVLNKGTLEQASSLMQCASWLAHLGAPPPFLPVKIHAELNVRIIHMRVEHSRIMKLFWGCYPSSHSAWPPFGDYSNAGGTGINTSRMLQHLARVLGFMTLVWALRFDNGGRNRRLS